MHFSHEQLQPYLDGETPPPDREIIAAHLQTCPDCQSALRQIQTRTERVGELLTSLSPTPAESVPTTQAYTRLQTKLNQKEPSMFQKLFSRKTRPALATGLILVALMFSLTIPSVRAAAVDFLGLFRVQQIQVVEFNPANLPKNLESSAENLEILLANNVQFEERGDPIEVSSADEASAIAGFPVILPQGVSGRTRLSVQPETTASFTVDLALWQTLLQEMGRGDISIPEELDGQTLTFRAEKSVTFAAGACLLEDNQYERLPHELRNCTLFVQMPSPTIDAPPNLPIQEMGQAALQFLGMSADEAARFSANIDWTTTLILPVPSGADYQEVPVQGVTGTILLGRYDSGRTEYSLMWVKDGIVYGLSGPGDVDDALALANSLK